MPPDLLQLNVSLPATTDSYEIPTPTATTYQHVSLPGSQPSKHFGQEGGNLQATSDGYAITATPFSSPVDYQTMQQEQPLDFSYLSPAGPMMTFPAGIDFSQWAMQSSPPTQPYQQPWTTPFGFGASSFDVPAFDVPIHPMDFSTMQQPVSPSSATSSFSKRSTCSSCSESDQDAQGSSDEEYRDGGIEVISPTAKKSRKSSLSSSASSSRSGGSKSSNEKRHACDYEGCGKAFARRFNLDKHYSSTHLGLKPYPCSACNKSFSRKHDLGRHVNAVHHAKDEPSITVDR